MSFRFRKSIRLFPGVRVNLSKSGMSVSVGGPGATVNIGGRGSSITLGLPGTGLSYRHRLGVPQATGGLDGRGAALPGGTAGSAGQPRVPTGPAPADPSPTAGEIRSSEVAGLTTPDLEGLKRLINEAAAQRASLAPDLAASLVERGRAWRRLRRREQLPLRLVLGRRIPAARTAFEQAEAEALKVIEAEALSEVRIEFAFDAAALEAQRALVEAHDRLSRAQKVWDVLSSKAVDRMRERSSASAAVTRTPVALSTAADGVVAGDQTGLRFQNANGADLDFFPGFLLMRDRGATDYALIDLRDVELRAEPVQFIEEEAIPGDSKVIGQAWAKANRDGSPDRRFRDNRQIPVVRYGALHFSTTTGVREAYHVSACERALSFATAFHRLQATLREMAMRPASDPPLSVAKLPSVDLASRLPPLPVVGGAHEFTMLIAVALAVLVVLATHAASPSRVPLTAVAEATRTQLDQGLATPTQPVQPSNTQDPPKVVPQPRQAVATSAPALSSANRERTQTVQPANMRAGPDMASAVIRVLPVGTVLDVFAHDGRWVQVGVGRPWGWANASVLKAAP